MAIKLFTEPELHNPVMLCGWSGIGNIGITAIDTIRRFLEAQEFGQIEPFDFFYPRKVVIQKGFLEDLEFPVNKFYFQDTGENDVIFFIGEEQPRERAAPYAEGRKGYEMAELVLDVASKFGCRRVYTSGAAVTQIHHSLTPQVWAVPNNPALIEEIRAYPNTVLMSDVEGGSGQGFISGLNGLILGVAKERDIDAVCLMGEIPYYLQGINWPYPKASMSVIEVFAEIFKMEIELKHLEQLAKKIEKKIDDFLQTLYGAEGVPPELKKHIESLRHTKQTRLGPITEEEQKKIVEHIDELFRGEEESGKRLV